MQQNLVKDLRKIRDQISSEIKDMTFEEERAYLDNYLPTKKSQHPTKVLSQVRLDIEAIGYKSLSAIVRLDE